MVYQFRECYSNEPQQFVLLEKKVYLKNEKEIDRQIGRQIDRKIDRDREIQIYTKIDKYNVYIYTYILSIKKYI